MRRMVHGKGRGIRLVLCGCAMLAGLLPGKVCLAEGRVLHVETETVLREAVHVGSRARPVRIVAPPKDFNQREYPTWGKNHPVQQEEAPANASARPAANTRQERAVVLPVSSRERAVVLPVSAKELPQQQAGAHSRIEGALPPESSRKQAIAPMPSPERGHPQIKEPARLEEKLPAPVVQNLLDNMDVYALSPHAHRLALSHMVSAPMAYAMQRSARELPGGWQDIIQRASAMHGLPTALIAAVIRVESNFTTEAISPKGAQGAMQIMPDTQKDLGLVDPFDPEANIMAGTRYLRLQLDKFKTLELALAAYNAGPGNVEKYGTIPPFEETMAFVKKVKTHMAAQ